MIAPPARRPPLRLATFAGITLLIAVVWLQAALAGLMENGHRADASSSLTHAYSTALAGGHAFIRHAPDPRLLALPNPYDPEQNAGLRLLDVSLFEGRYYLYFGVVPWLLLFVPWFIATGQFLSDAAAIWVFCAVGLGAYAGALFQVWRRWFAAVSLRLLLAAGLVLAVASGAWPLLALPQMTQVPPAAAYMLLGLACYALVCAEVHPSARRPWLAAAMIAAGLIMGCRPNYAPTVALLAGWAFFRVWTGQPAKRSRSLLFVFFPLAIIGALLAAWNFLRFGHPLEFGFSYQLVAVNRAAGEGELSVRYLPFNLHRYVVGGARWTDYFPFIAGEVPGPFHLPSGHDASDQVYGAAWIAPVLIAGLAAVFGAPASPARRLARVIAACGFSNLLLLGSFGGSAYRYFADFLPPLAFVAALGVMTVAIIPRPWPRRAATTACTGLLAWSSAVGLFQVAALYNQLAERHPEAFRLLSRPFNAVIYASERLRGEGPRGLRLHLSFPTDRTGQLEPLVVLGPDSAQDFLYAYYTGPDTIRFGFEAIGRGGPVSRLVSVDLRRPHTLDLNYGSFLPPEDHPLLAALAPPDRELARRMLHVQLNGRPVLDGWADFHPPRGMEHIGSSPADNAFGAKFTGVIHRVERPFLPIPLSPVRHDPASYGPMALTLILQPVSVGTREPLLSFGHRNQGQLFLIERLAADQIRIGYAATAGTPLWSEPFHWPPGRSNTITFSTGALLPPVTSSLWPATVSPEARALAKRNLEFQLDGRTVWHTEIPPLDVSPSTVVAGRNDLLFSGIAPALAAEILHTLRLPWAGLTN